ncbi:MAG TPA: hypothetical protein VII63_10435 [Caulobacteraceae bacterium]
MGGDGERGYALVAAVTAVAAFAYIAFQVLATNEGTVAAIAGRAEQAKLAAGADAGIMIAIHGLAAEDRTARWSIDGKPRQVDFDGMDLTVVVQDERGKAPLAGLTETQARALFEGAGAEGDRLDALVDEFREWQAQADAEAVAQPAAPAAAGAPAAVGAPASEDSALNAQARGGQFRTVGELMALKDMDSALFAAIAPAVTVFFEESGPFEPKNAGPLAIRTMNAQTGTNPLALTGDSEFASERPVEQIVPDDNLVGRTLTIGVVARDREGGRTHRTAIVELTGNKVQPYWIRYVE